MNKKRNELEAELRLLNQRFPDRQKFSAAFAFLEVHLQLARNAKNSAPVFAIEQYKMAESCQCCLGTFATGSGEGLASMSALYDIMAERAELQERLSYARKRLNEKIQNLQAALDAWAEIRNAPNLGDLLPKKDIEPLKKPLEVWKSMAKKIRKV